MAITPKQRYKEKVKQRVLASNLNEAMGLDADPWVIQYRLKNNLSKAKWKAKTPKKEKIKTPLNPESFKKVIVRKKKLSDEQREASLIKQRLRTRNWHRVNRERVNEYRRIKRQRNIDFKLKCNLRKRLSFILRKNIVSKSTQTMECLGCSIQDFMKHLKSKFSDGMSFENYGQWHIDHITPVDSFDFTKKEDIKKCFHFTNMQPLWAVDNRRKSNKILN